MRMLPLERRLILALDTPDRESAVDLVRRTRGTVASYKVGLELFTSQGPSFVQWLRREGAEVFLDLKLHDIPNTVRGAVSQASRLGVSWLTLHALGGLEALRAAMRARSEQTMLPGAEPMRMLAVSVLTHHSAESLAAIGLPPDPERVVAQLIELARSAGLDGCVCSPREVRMVRQQAGDDFLIVTPGIRPPGVPADDQARTATPFEAIRDGADCLVVGRPIRMAPEPAKMAAEILGEIQRGLEARQ